MTTLVKGEPLGDAVLLMKRMAHEIIDLYARLDEIGDMVGLPEFPRNRDLIDAVEEFAKQFPQEQE